MNKKSDKDKLIELYEKALIHIAKTHYSSAGFAAEILKMGEIIKSKNTKLRDVW